MVDLAGKLASDFLAAQGWCCILLTAHDAARQAIVTVESIAAREEPGQRIWLASKHADRVMAALLSRCQEARRRPRGSGLIVALPVTVVAAQIRGIADSFGFALVGDEFIDAQLALVSRRIADALPKVTKGLGREYKLAKSSGTTLPRYQDWLVARLKPALQAGLC